MPDSDPSRSRATLASEDLITTRREAIAELFPEVMCEGRIDFDRLRRVLGDSVDDSEERYGLSWKGKSKAIQAVRQPAPGTLVPDRAASLDFDQTENVFIEGDNLEVLKLLQKAYTGTVRMIYIDPPYNTGSDLLYSDDYTQTLPEYRADAAPRRPGPPRTSSHSEASGRRHSAWLSMMLPRLHLARNLLREDGVIFVSIDHHELHNLMHLLDEVFGPENFIELFTWVRTATPAALARKSKKVVEYVVCYERTRSGRAYRGIEKPVQSTNPLLNRPNSVRELVFPAGAVHTKLPNQIFPAGRYGTERYAVDLLEETAVASGRFIQPVRLKARFRWTQSYLEAQLAAGVRISIASPRLVPSYAKARYGREAPPNLIDARVGVGTNEHASAELQALLDVGRDPTFDRMHPKPTSLLRYLIDAVCDDDDLVMDFFAGSGTTGHAVMQLNAERGGRRRFLLVQRPEATGSARFPTIADLTRARLHAASAALRAAHPDTALDLGVRSYRLAESHFEPWTDERERPADLAHQLQHATVRVRPGATDWAVLTELLLKTGRQPTTPVQTLELEGTTVFAVDGGQTLVCLADPISPAVLRAMMAQAPRTILCLDQAFRGDDTLRTNTVCEMRSHGISHFRTV